MILIVLMVSIIRSSKLLLKNQLRILMINIKPATTRMIMLVSALVFIGIWLLIRVLDGILNCFKVIQTALCFIGRSLKIQLIIYCNASNFPSVSVVLLRSIQIFKLRSFVEKINIFTEYRKSLF